MAISEFKPREGLTVKELCDEFMKSTRGIMPGNWKLVGIQAFILVEEAEVLATPGFYSRGFDRANYGGEE